MGLGHEDSSLVQMAHQADEDDGVCVEVTLLVGGTQLRGRLVSEVRYCQIQADTVRRGNASPVGEAYDVLTGQARQRREERQHARATRPHLPLDPPHLIYLVEYPDWARAWCLPLDRVDAWTMDALTVDLPDA
ncbi:hypothetical protein [Streptomyces axinellae]|uniref:Uncharacterized protein n=1 Tax=Streptomyces axinellae TaxID=552788 RepID=A0ABP6DD74_9ACTN